MGRKKKDQQDIYIRKEADPNADKSSYYINKDEFYEEICRCRENDMLSEKLVNMFTLLANKIASKMYYKESADKYDCISTGILKCVTYWKSFDPEKSKNPFAYFTTVCTYGIAAGWHELQKGKTPTSLTVSISDQIYSI